MTSLHDAWSGDHDNRSARQPLGIKHLPARNYRRRWSDIGPIIALRSTIITHAMHYQCNAEDLLHLHCISITWLQFGKVHVNAILIIYSYEMCRILTRILTTQQLLVVPRHQLSSYGRRAFCVAGPSVWNSPPDSLRNPIIGGNSFRRSLETFLSQRTDAFSELEVSRRCAI